MTDSVAGHLVSSSSADAPEADDDREVLAICGPVTFQISFKSAPFARNRGQMDATGLPSFEAFAESTDAIRRVIEVTVGIRITPATGPGEAPSSDDDLITKNKGARRSERPCEGGRLWPIS